MEVATNLISLTIFFLVITLFFIALVKLYQIIFRDVLDKYSLSKVHIFIGLLISILLLGTGTPVNTTINTASPLRNHSLSTIFSNLIKGIQQTENIPLVFDFIVFLISWLLFSLLSKILLELTIDYSSREKWYLLKNNPELKNVLTIGIVLFSIYLCIASLVAVPEFQNLVQNTKAEEEVNQLRSYFESLNGTDKEKLLIKFDTTKTVNALSAKTIGVIKNNQKIFNDKVTALVDDDEIYKKRLLEAFKISLQENTSKSQTIKYRSSLNEAYLEFRQTWTNEVVQKKGLIESQIINILNSENTDIQSNLSQLNLFGTAFLKFKIAITIPKKPTPGEQFGIFAKTFKWLLATESLSLALIVGMFGFSILGAMATTLIQEFKIKENTMDYTPIIQKDLFTILLNGISATIIVFLAAKGTIIILTTDNDTNLNPYTLLFACFVASMYSDVVWAWTKSWMENKLKGYDSNPSDPNVANTQNTPPEKPKENIPNEDDKPSESATEGGGSPTS